MLLQTDRTDKAALQTCNFQFIPVVDSRALHSKQSRRNRRACKADKGGGRGRFGGNRFPPNPQKRHKRANAFPRKSGRAKPRKIRIYDVPHIFPHIHFYDS